MKFKSSSGGGIGVGGVECRPDENGVVDIPDSIVAANIADITAHGFAPYVAPPVAEADPNSDPKPGDADPPADNEGEGDGDADKKPGGKKSGKK